MKSVTRSNTWRGIAFVAAFTAAAQASTARAQEAGQGLSAETKAILGGADSSSALDADVMTVLGQPAESKPAEGVAGERAADIASKLRCPVCQGVSIADSPSSMATKMRGQVRELVAQGYSEEQVLSYFERSYGEFVRLEPPVRGLNIMLWILPGVVLLGGALLVFRKAVAPLPANAASPNQGAAPGPQAADVDPELAKYLDRIRRDSGTSS